MYIADTNIVGESDLSQEFFVYWRNRFHRPEVFATLYADSFKRPPICGFGGEWKSDHEDPQDILDDLLAFMAEDFERIPGNALTIGKEQRAMIIPQTKAGSSAAKSFAHRQSQDSAHQYVLIGAAAVGEAMTGISIETGEMSSHGGSRCLGQSRKT